MMRLEIRHALLALIGIVEEDMDSLIQSNTFPMGDISTLNESARIDKGRYEEALSSAYNALLRFD